MGKPCAECDYDHHRVLYQERTTVLYITVQCMYSTVPYSAVSKSAETTNGCYCSIRPIYPPTRPSIHSLTHPLIHSRRLTQSGAHPHSIRHSLAQSGTRSLDLVATRGQDRARRGRARFHDVLKPSVPAAHHSQLTTVPPRQYCGSYAPGSTLRPLRRGWLASYAGTVQ